MTSPKEIRVAIVGVGNCANSLIQGVYYYKDAPTDQEIPGLMNVVVGGYHVRDVKFVAAFDVDETLVLWHEKEKDDHFTGDDGCRFRAQG